MTKKLKKNYKFCEFGGVYEIKSLFYKRFDERRSDKNL